MVLLPTRANMSIAVFDPGRLFNRKYTLTYTVPAVSKKT